jgi:hypothetical protein
MHRSRGRLIPGSGPAPHASVAIHASLRHDFKSMFEFHGWIVIQVGVLPNSPAYDLREREALEFVRAAVADAQDEISLFDFVQAGNGLDVVRINGLRNHRRDEAITLFRRIAAKLPASYGLLHIHDPEAPVHDNAFRVFRMARGKVEEFEDLMLSPRFPTIEDEFLGED